MAASKPQVLAEAAVNGVMNISGASLTDGLMSAASAMQGGEVTQQIATAVLKQQLDQQEKQAAALVKMISQPTPSLTGTGAVIDISA